MVKNNEIEFKEKAWINGLDRPPYGMPTNQIPHKEPGLFPAPLTFPGSFPPKRRVKTLCDLHTVELVMHGFSSKDVTGVTKSVTNHSFLTACLTHND